MAKSYTWSVYNDEHGASTFSSDDLITTKQAAQK